MHRQCSSQSPQPLPPTHPTPAAQQVVLLAIRYPKDELKPCFLLGGVRWWAHPARTINFTRACVSLRVRISGRSTPHLHTPAHPSVQHQLHSASSLNDSWGWGTKNGKSRLIAATAALTHVPAKRAAPPSPPLTFFPTVVTTPLPLPPGSLGSEQLVEPSLSKCSAIGSVENS